MSESVFDSESYLAIRSALDDVERQVKTRSIAIVEAAIARGRPEMASVLIRSEMSVASALAHLGVAGSKVPV
jgi:hypothetical protein